MLFNSLIDSMQCKSNFIEHNTQTLNKTMVFVKLHELHLKNKFAIVIIYKS